MPIAPLEANLTHAPGAPGISPSWTSSTKDMVGTSLGQARLWFTLGFGVVNEIYYPRVDIPQIRDLGFIVAGPGGFWSEVKRNQDYTLRLLAPGVPAVEVVHKHERYTLRLRITPDPRRDVLSSNAGSRAIPRSACTRCWPRIWVQPAGTTSRRSSVIAAGVSCGPSRARSAAPSPPPARARTTSSVGPAPAMSVPAMAGRISTITAQ
jgi:hypothetical protein